MNRFDLAQRPDGKHCMGITIKTELLHCVMVLYTSVNTHFPALPETFRLFELFNA